MSARSVVTASRTRMKRNVTKIVFTSGDIAGLAQHFSCWALIGLSMRVQIGPVKPTHAAIAVKNLDAVAGLDVRGSRRTVTGTND